MKQCPKRKAFGPCEFTIGTLPAKKLETVEDLLKYQRCPKDMRGKRLAYICIYCGRERID